MSLLPKGHEGPLFHSRMTRPVVGGGGPARGQTGVSQRAHVGFLRSRPPAPHRISLRLAARLLRLPLKGGVIALGARASRPHPVPLAAAELQCDAAGSHPVGGNSSGQAEGEPWRRSRLIQVGEMASPHFSPGGVMMAQEFSPQRVLASEEHSGDYVRASMCALRGKGQARARPAQSVVASPSNSTNQGTEDKPLFTMHSATW